MKISKRFSKKANQLRIRLQELQNKKNKTDDEMKECCCLNREIYRYWNNYED